VTEDAPSQDALATIATDQAAALDAAMRAGRVPKSRRADARALLMHLFLVAAPPDESDAGATTHASDLAKIRADLRAADDLARGPDPRSPARRFFEMTLRRPMPSRWYPVTSSSVQHLATSVWRAAHPPLALTRERLDWFDERVSKANPGLIKPVREPKSETPDGVPNRAEYELLRKKGPSRFW